MATSRGDVHAGGRESHMDVNPFAARVDALADDEFALLREAVGTRACRDAHGWGAFAEAADSFRPRPPCPLCGDGGRPVRDGRAPNGSQRWLCRACGRRYGSLTNTIFERTKADFPTWVAFVSAMCWNCQLDAAAELCGISHRTAFEWRHRVFAAVRTRQDSIVLSGRVWIDETYVTDASLMGDPDWRPRSGLSRNKLCIAVAIDARKDMVAVVCGHGKPGSGRIKDALLSHIAPGSTMVHDMEKPHGALVRALGGTDEAYRADTRDPAHLEGMRLVNSLCPWIKRYLWRFPGMRPENLQDYLDWYVYLFRVKRDDETWPKLERVVRHLVMTDATYRRSRGV